MPCFKYDYLFGGEDFTPYLSASVDGMDIYRYIFNPGCILDICVKYVRNGKLYRFETGNRKDLRPLTTVAGNCYCVDPVSPAVPRHVAVDMGTSVMWAPFNMGAEDDLTATSQNIGTLKGNYWMWGVNCVSSSFGSSAYQKYNNGTPTTLHYGYYLSSTSYPDNVAKAKSTLFRDIGSLAGLNSNADRYTGLPVRPVYTAR